MEDIAYPTESLIFDSCIGKSECNIGAFCNATVDNEIIGVWANCTTDLPSNCTSESVVSLDGDPKMKGLMLCA